MLMLVDVAHALTVPPSSCRPLSRSLVPRKHQVRPPLPVGRQLRGGSELPLLFCVRGRHGGAHLLHDGRDGGEGGAEAGGGGRRVRGESLGGGGVK